MSKSIKQNQAYRQKVLDVANHIVKRRATVRSAADAFNISKSTVHNYVSKKLETIDPELYRTVQIILKYHAAVRHLRGGEATKIMYKKKAG